MRWSARRLWGDRLNYYPFNVGDYAAHTAHLEPMEDLAYRRLLDQYYLREGPLPADIQATAKLVRMRSMAADVESVLREFFTLTDDGWRHSRCDSEVEKMQDKQAKARASAAVSVSVRQANQRAAAERALMSAQANAERTLPDSPTDVELPTPTPTPIKRERAAQPAGRGQRLPPEWTPEPIHMAFAEGLGLRNGKAAAELEKFRDYWAAQPGQKGVKTDWPATWRNWVRRATEATAAAGSAPGRAGAFDMEGVH